MPFAALLLLAQASAFPEARVTLRTEAPSVRRLLLDLSAQTGTKLRAAGVVADERVVIDVRNVTLRDLMPRLARATIAEWRRNDQGFLLLRPESLLRDREDRLFKEAADAVRTGIARRVQRLKRQGDWSQIQANLVVERIGQEQRKQAETRSDAPIADDLLGDSPGHRLATRLLATLSSQEIAGIPDGHSATFSTRPNKGQRPFPTDVGAAIGTFKSEQSFWTNAIQNNPKVNEYEAVRAVEGSGRPMYTDTGPPQYGYRWNRQAAPDKVLMSVSRYGGIYFSYHVTVADSRGNVILSESNQLNPQPSSGEKPIPAAPPNEEPIKLGSPAMELVKAIGTMFYDPATDPELSPAVRAILLQPEKRDPMSLVLAEVLQRVAEIRHENLIACLPDYWASGIAMWFEWDGKTRSQKVLDDISERAGQKVAEADGWLEIGLDNPAQRIDRPALGRLFRAVDAAGNIRILDIAAYAALHEELDHYPYELLDRIPRRTFEYETTGLDWKMLRVLGMLSPQQRQAAAGRGLPLSALPPAARDLIQRGFDDDEYVVDSLAPKGPGANRSEYETIFDKSLEAVPNGIEAGAFLTIRATAMPVIYGTSQADPARTAQWEWVPAQRVLDLIDQPSGAGSFEQKQLATATSTELTIQVHYSSRYYTESPFVDRAFLSQFPVTAMPHGLREIAAAAKKAEEEARIRG